MLIRWLLAFLWTLALELPVYALWLAPRLRSAAATCGLVLAINAITHPLLWFVMPRPASYAAYLAIGESGVVVLEAALIAGVLRRHPRPVWIAIGASLSANALSTAVGMLILPWFYA